MQHDLIIHPSPSSLEARMSYAGNFATRFTTTHDLLGFRPPEQLIWVGNHATTVDLPVYGDDFLDKIPSSLFTTYLVGTRRLAEAALEELSYACLQALSDTDPLEVNDAALLGLWYHPVKDFALLGVFGTGAWTTPFADHLSSLSLGLLSLASPSHGRDPSVFLPDFVDRHAGLLPPGQLSGVVETVLVNLVSAGQLSETLENLRDYPALLAGYQQLLVPPRLHHSRVLNPV